MGSAESGTWGSAISPRTQSADPEQVRAVSTLSAEWTQTTRAQLFQVIFLAVTPEETAVPQVRGQPLYCPQADLPREVAKKTLRHIDTLSCSHSGQSQKLPLVGGWGLGYHQDCRES